MYTAMKRYTRKRWMAEAQANRWSIYRLEVLLSTGSSDIFPSRAVTEGQTENVVVKKAVQTEVNEKSRRSRNRNRNEQEVAEVHGASNSEEQEWALSSKYSTILRNKFLLRKHVVQKKCDVEVCECAPESECRSKSPEPCLNAFTNVECTLNYCPCGNLCQNQKFQKCEYARVQKLETRNRGWGLFAGQNIKKSDFVIEYCGEVIPNKLAQSRMRAYAVAGLKETYMMYLSGTESLDATRKGNLSRFFNHSCEPNCIARKWNVLGELRIGFFTLRDIESGEELTYDYKLQLRGKSTFKCLCGAPSCVGFLGAKFQASQNNESRSSAKKPELNISATNNQGDLKMEELLKRLYVLAIGFRGVRGLSAQPRPVETTSARDANMMNPADCVKW